MWEEKFVEKKEWSISALQIDYLNLENAVRATETEIFDPSRCSNCGGSYPTEKCFKQ